MATIWVPNSHEHREAAAVRRTVSNYDPDLSFGKNDETGQWCIFMRQGTTEMSREYDLPILGFNEVPHPDEALARLTHSDARRRGREILDELNAHNENINAERKRRADDAVGATAEAFEWGFRAMGKHPTQRIFIPGN